MLCEFQIPDGQAHEPRSAAGCRARRQQGVLLQLRVTRRAGAMPASGSSSSSIRKHLAKYVLPPVDRPCHGRCPTVGGTGHARDVSRTTGSARKERAPAILARPSSHLAGAGHLAASLRRRDIFNLDRLVTILARFDGFFPCPVDESSTYTYAATRSRVKSARMKGGTVEVGLTQVKSVFDRRNSGRVEQRSRHRQVRVASRGPGSMLRQRVNSPCPK